MTAEKIMRRLQIKPCFPLLGVAVGLALIMPGCSSKPSNSYEGYVEGKFVYVASPQGERLTHLSVSRGETVAVSHPLFSLDREP